MYSVTAGNVRFDAAVAVAAASAVVDRGCRRVYALTTEPGHHAGPESFGGFCYCNNAALIAAGLADRLGGRVAVVDVDYHTGNGTMAIFYSDPSVFVASLHMDPEFDYPACSGFGERMPAVCGVRRVDARVLS